MQRNGKLLVMCLLMVPMLTLVFTAPPAVAKSTPIIVQPTMAWEQPNVFELYGPRLNNTHYVFTGKPENSFLGLENGLYDIIDWPLSKAWKDTWEDPARTDIKVMGYGGEYGFYPLDVREDESKPVNPGWSTQSYCLFGDPELVDIDMTAFGDTDPYTTTRAAAARRAIAHMIDRTWIVSTEMGGLGEPIYVPAPNAHGGFNNPYVEKYPYNFDAARSLLDQAGVEDTDADGDDWREIPGTGENIVLDFYIRTGTPRENTGIKIANEIEAELDIQVNRLVFGSDVAYPHVMIAREGDMYTGGWINVVFPDHYIDLYSSEGWWPLPSTDSPPNYMAYCGPHPAGADPHFDEEVDAAAKTIVSALDPDEVRDACWAVQELMMKHENVYVIPMVSTAAPKAWRTYMRGTGVDPLPAEPGNEWKGIVNQTAQGVNNWWTFLNAHTDNMPDPSSGGTMIYGLSYVEVDKLNPIYASWYQTWEVMGGIWDSLLYLDPIDRVTMKPWVASSFIHVKEYDSEQGMEVSVLYFDMRKDVYWQDGEQLTADDVIFTLKYLPGNLTARGLPPAWWDSNVRDINRVVKIDDFSIKVYMSFPTYFAPIYVGGNIIMPEHIWAPIVTTGDPQAFAPDPDIIGSGPYQMDESDYKPTVSADVYAYKPASTGYFQYSRIQNFVARGESRSIWGNDIPAGPTTYWIGLEKIGQATVNTRVTNHDLYSSHAVTVKLYDGPTPIETKNIVAPADSTTVVTFSVSLPAGSIGDLKGPYTMKVEGTFGPVPGIDIDTEVIYFKYTIVGDTISTYDNPGVADVNNFDGSAISRNYGPAGMGTYPAANTNWDGTVNVLDALEVGREAHYGKPGA